jgi:hypothetical protein
MVQKGSILNKLALDKLPSVLRQLPWQQYEAGQDFGDGDRLLVAVEVPIKQGDHNSVTTYELWVISVHHDIYGYFCQLPNGDDWGEWVLRDVSWWVKL